LGGCWLLSLLAPSLLLAIHGAPTTVSDRVANAIEFTPILRLPEFIMGMLLGRIWTLGFRLKPSWCRFATAVSLLSVLAVMSQDTASIRPLIAGGLLAPLFALLIVSLAEGYGSFAQLLSWKPIVLLGEASYGIYILQVPVAYAIGLKPPISSLPLLLAYLSVLFVSALASWRFVEGPMRSWIKNRLDCKATSAIR
jgi:peptidoglycan/LPS O-acetylase OafA/YrhL